MQVRQAVRCGSCTLVGTAWKVGGPRRCCHSGSGRLVVDGIAWCLCKRVGAGYSVTSCDLRILMDQSTESISAHHPPSRHDDRWLARPEWRQLSQGTVWAANVVMVDELS